MSDTSASAYQKVSSSAANMRDEILSYIKTHGPRTCDEIEVEMAFKHQTASARISELKKSGELVDSGLRRLTRSGSNAAVYFLGSLPAAQTEI